MKPDAEVLEPIQRVRFTKSTLRQASIRERKGPSLGKIQVKPRHQRSPYAMKFGDRSHEETERQQRCARSKAWNLHKICTSSKRTTRLHSCRLQKSLFSRLRQQKSQRGENLWLILERVCKWSARKTLTLLSWRLMRTSRSPTTVMTANGEVQTREDVTVHVKQLDLFVKVMLLEETPAVLSLGKLCEDHGYTYHWTSGQKPHLTQNGKRIDGNISQTKGHS